MSLNGTVGAGTVESGVAGTPPTFTAGGTQVGTLCRAWVDFAGASGVVNAAFNVSSVTRTAAGTYTINFTNAMPDANYALSGMAQFATSGGAQALVAIQAVAAPKTTGAAYISTVRSDNGTATDFTDVSVAIFR